MKIFSTLPRPVLYAAGIVLVILIASTSYLVGSNAMKDKDNSNAVKECPYTQDDLERLYEKIKDRKSELYMESNGIEAPSLIDAKAIAALEGECVDVGLEKAYQLGITTLRDHTDCWPNCMITLEFLDTRMNYVIEDRRLTQVHNG